MRLSLITPPALEPLTLQGVKDHLRVTWTEEDARITALITAARQAFEGETGRQLVTASWRGFLDRFPPFDIEPIVVAKPPLISVTSITYIDSSGISQTWAASEYDVQVFAGPDARRGTVAPKPDFDYPTTRRVPNAVTVNFDAGYGATAADVPDEIKEALYAWIGHHYLHRETVVVGQAVNAIPSLSFDRWIDQDFG